MSKKSIGMSSLILVASLVSWCLPTAAGEWISNGPYGGYIEVVAAVPGKPHHVLAASSRALFETTNGGVDWQVVETLGDLRVVALAVGGTTGGSQIIYAASELQGVFRSDDGGETWAVTSPTLPPSLAAATDLILDASSPQTLFLAGYTDMSAVLKSTDGGATWATGTGLPDMAFSLAMDPTDPQVIYAGSVSEVLKTIDGGSSWTRMSLPGIDRLQALAVDPTDHAIVYAGHDDGVLISNDGGATWGAAGDLTASVKELVFAPVDASVIYSGTDDAGVFRSMDGGTTWLAVNNGLTTQGASSLAFAGGEIFLGSNDGVFKTSDPVVGWSAVNQGLHATWINQLAIDVTDPTVLYATTFSGVYKSLDGGLSPHEP